MIGPHGALGVFGGGEFQPHASSWDLALAAAAAASTVTVIPAAAQRDAPRALENARRHYRGLGLEMQAVDLISRRDAARPDVVEACRDARYAMLLGGNPGHLLESLQGTLAWAALVEAWRGGASLGGSSAGAMVMAGWLLLRAGWPDRTRRRPVPALNLLRDAAVLPHYSDFGRQWEEGARQALPDADLLALDEGMGLVHSPGAGWRTFGDGVVAVIGPRRRVLPKEGRLRWRSPG